MSAMLASRVGPSGRVDTVEPDAQKAAWLTRRCANVHRVALSDEPGEATFFVNVKRRGFSGLRRHGAETAGADGVLEQRVPVETLDRLHPADAPLRLIKIDVEGAELAALRGGAETIRRCRPTIVFECTRSGMDAFGYDSDAMFAFFRDELDYEIFLLEDHLANLDTPGAAGTSRPAMTQAQFADAHVFPWRAYNYVGVPSAADASIRLVTTDVAA
ncbi:MAG: FkbM family methyltransferase [Planctomycetota bacterium]